jgi:hypothetical protein
MDSKGPYSPPSGGNSQGGEGACKVLVLRDTEGSMPSPPTVFDCLKRWHAAHSKHAAVAQW